MLNYTDNIYMFIVLFSILLIIICFFIFSKISSKYAAEDILRWKEYFLPAKFTPIQCRISKNKNNTDKCNMYSDNRVNSKCNKTKIAESLNNISRRIGKLRRIMDSGRDIF